MWTAFDYMYRDAGNFKAFGSVVLEGVLSPTDERMICSRLSSEEYFIAEQIGVPPLYEQLYKWSGGPTPSDHCWHEFVGFRDIPAPQEATAAIRVGEFVSRFARLQYWDQSLSANFSLANAF